MTLRTLFTINIVLATFFGLTCAIVPVQLIALYGLGLSPAGVWVTRLLGGSLLGFATLMWYGRTMASVEAGRAIALALFAQDIVGTAASLQIQLTGLPNAFGWSNPVLYGLLTLGYAYFAFLPSKPVAA